MLITAVSLYVAGKSEVVIGSWHPEGLPDCPLVSLASVEKNPECIRLLCYVTLHKNMDRARGVMIYDITVL